MEKRRKYSLERCIWVVDWEAEAEKRQKNFHECRAEGR